MGLVLSEPTVGHQDGDRGQELFHFAGRVVSAQGFQLLQSEKAIGENALEFVAGDVPLAFDGPNEPRGVVASAQDVLEPGQLLVRPSVVDQAFPQGVEGDGIARVAHQLANVVRVFAQAMAQAERQRHIRGGLGGLALGQSSGGAQSDGSGRRFHGAQRH